MLVLKRKRGQAILIPDLGIRISVQACDNQATRIGIEAPPNINIVREEIHDTARGDRYLRNRGTAGTDSD